MFFHLKDGKPEHSNEIWKGSWTEEGRTEVSESMLVNHL